MAGLSLSAAARADDTLAATVETVEFCGVNGTNISGIVSIGSGGLGMFTKPYFCLHNGTLILSGAQPDITHSILVSRHWTAQVGDTTVLVGPQSSILQVNDPDHMVLTSPFLGDGDLFKTGGGTVTLTSGTSAYTGAFTISQGEVHLRSAADAPAVFGDPDAQGARAKVITEVGTRLVGWGVLNADVTNRGTISLEDGTAGQVMTINGDYTSAGGAIYFDSILLGDPSRTQTDVFRISGDSFSQGRDTIHITDLRALDDPSRTERVLLIEVTGAAGAEFQLSGTISKGAFDYGLVREGSSWYLQSQQTLRAEVGSYEAASMRIFDFSKAQRIWSDAEKPHVGNSWLQLRTQHSHARHGAGQIQSDSDQQTLQLGFDLAALDKGGNDSLVIGVMAGLGQQASVSRSVVSGQLSSSDIKASAVGLHATWSEHHDKPLAGWGVDFYLTKEWIEGEVNGGAAPPTKLRFEAVEASAEVQYGFAHQTGTQSWLSIVPQLQLQWRSLQSANFTDAAGAAVDLGGTQFDARLGVLVSSEHNLNGADERVNFFARLDYLDTLDAPDLSVDGFGIERRGEPGGRVGIGMLYQSSARASAELRLDYEDQASAGRKLGGVLAVKYRF